MKTVKIVTALILMGCVQQGFAAQNTHSNTQYQTTVIQTMISVHNQST